MFTSQPWCLSFPLQHAVKVIHSTTVIVMEAPPPPPQSTRVNEDPEHALSARVSVTTDNLTSSCASRGLKKNRLPWQLEHAQCGPLPKYRENLSILSVCRSVELSVYYLSIERGEPARERASERASEPASERAS